jgi:hypothetical protein
MCSTGHPWLDGVPACGCDALSTEVPGYVRFTLEPLPAAAARTVITADPATSARRPVARVVEAPILSDGWWQWDGASWIPADTPPTAPDPVAPTAPTPGTPTPAQETPEWATWSAPAVAPMPAMAAPTAHTAPVAPPSYPGPSLRSAPPVPSAPGAGAVLPPWSGSPPGWQTPPPGWNAPPWAQGERGRDGRAIAALVCSLIPIFLVAQVAAVVLAIIALVSVGKTGRKGQVMAIFAIGVSVLMFFVSAAIAIPVFLQQRGAADDASVRNDLRSAAAAEETYHSEHGVYANASALSGVFTPGPHTRLTVDAGPRAFCIAGATDRTIGRWYVVSSNGDVVSPTRYSTDYAAINACAQAIVGPGSAA